MRVVKKEFSSFEWDEGKRLSNIEKHGIDFLTAAVALMQPHLESRTDRNGEVRILAICSESARIIVVIYTMRADTCRIISARAARKHERESYSQVFTRRDS
ncbi:BrnT family toxin [Rhizobium sp. L1K21]|uniref:BrnT family toxin n=1 Tax=Rhizobium sp. L1K21 TaxID=2954933 RepID=UPI0020931300|nr:BrnT family toxin [Rhizobium sp. L1K21]MCO6185517.1 BrnT family toxin [Rhizobium sp. L1K21]